MSFADPQFSQYYDRSTGQFNTSKFKKDHTGPDVFKMTESIFSQQHQVEQGHEMMAEQSKKTILKPMLDQYKKSDDEKKKRNEEKEKRKAKRDENIEKLVETLVKKEIKEEEPKMKKEKEKEHEEKKEEEEEAGEAGEAGKEEKKGSPPPYRAGLGFYILDIDKVYMHGWQKQKKRKGVLTSEHDTHTLWIYDPNKDPDKIIQDPEYKKRFLSNADVEKIFNETNIKKYPGNPVKLTKTDTKSDIEDAKKRVVEVIKSNWGTGKKQKLDCILSPSRYSDYLKLGRLYVHKPSLYNYSKFILIDENGKQYYNDFISAGLYSLLSRKITPKPHMYNTQDVYDYANILIMSNSIPSLGRRKIIEKHIANYTNGIAKKQNFEKARKKIKAIPKDNENKNIVYVKDDGELVNQLANLCATYQNGNHAPEIKDSAYQIMKYLMKHGKLTDSEFDMCIETFQ